MTINKQPLCSICCLGYRHVHFITDCIESLWNQEYKNIEIIALDDGSNDGSNDKLKELCRRSPCPMTILEQENTGNVPLNFNRTLHAASGEYIMFISLDDMLYPTAISEKIDTMTANSKIAFIANTQITGINDNGQEISTIPPLSSNSKSEMSLDDILYMEYSSFGTFYIQGTLFRKDIIDAIHGFDEDILGDDIVLRTKTFLYMKEHPGYEFVLLHSSACYYRIHESNLHYNVARQITIVSQYLERFHPEKSNPNEFVLWLEHGMNQFSIHEILSLFIHHKRVRQYFYTAKGFYSFYRKIRKTVKASLKRLFHSLWKRITFQSNK